MAAIFLSVSSQYLTDLEAPPAMLLRSSWFFTFFHHVMLGSTSEMQERRFFAQLNL
jgi:hypothetical protein